MFSTLALRFFLFVSHFQSLIPECACDVVFHFHLDSDDGDGDNHRHRHSMTYMQNTRFIVNRNSKQQQQTKKHCQPERVLFGVNFTETKISAVIRHACMTFVVRGADFHITSPKLLY